MELSPRYNELGYQVSDQNLNDYLGFSGSKMSLTKQMLTKAHVGSFGDFYSFPPKQPKLPDITLDLPSVNNDIVGFLDEHANKLFEPLRQRLRQFVSNREPVFPTQILKQSGWYRYSTEEKDPLDFVPDSSSTQKVEKVSYPLENELVIDTETWVKRGAYPIIVSCLSAKAFYLWLHPVLINPEIPFEPVLVPIGEGKLVINHNVMYDAARFAETYIRPAKNHFFDTYSAHIATSGMSNKQVQNYKYLKGKALWTNHTAPNNLLDAYNYHVAPLRKLTPADKKVRDIFVENNDPYKFHELLDVLVDYALKDVLYTFRLAKALIPKYLECSNITLGGHFLLNSSFLPVIEDYQNRLQSIRGTHARIENEISLGLKKLADKYLKEFQQGTLEPEKDPWLSQLDWQVLSKRSKKNAGLPKWYAHKVKGTLLTTKSSLAPLLLKMSYNVGTSDKPVYSPLIYNSKFKWIFRVNQSYPLAIKLDSSPVAYESPFSAGYYARVPHKKGDKANVGSPLGKDYIYAVETGQLHSDEPGALGYLKKAKSVSYWTSIDSRVSNYYTVPMKGLPGSMISPTLAAHGTCSRRCTERLWLTTSGAKPSVVGSELKGLIRAPKGYVLVGADFDSQELRIGAAFADAYRALEHGSTPFGYRNLHGSKKDKTDGHSLLADLIGLERQVAKTLNFSMQYLSGVQTNAQLIKSHKPELDYETCKEMAQKAMKFSRGKKSKGLFNGGTDSDAFNFMLTLANGKVMPEHLQHLYHGRHPKTPALGSKMSEAIIETNTGASQFLTSRANWGIQSSGVDILHLFLVSLSYLKEHYKLNIELPLFTYHDETWVLVPEKEAYLAVHSFQVAHLWSWAYFYRKLGFPDIPYSYLFFSSVNVDKSFRKEVDESQITISNPEDNLSDGETYSYY